MEVLKKNHIKTNKSAALVLENGEVFLGYGLGVQKAVVGELCFNTSQTGYQETLTDPLHKKIIKYTNPVENMWISYGSLITFLFFT